MKKYLGIIKIEIESIAGLNLKILTKFSNEKYYLEKWLRLYPNSKKLILENNEELQDFFKDFEDNSPVTQDEFNTSKSLYERFIIKE